MKDLKVRATKDQIKEFKSSILWKDIKRELAAWKKGFEVERASIVDSAATENPSTATVLMHLGDINGRIKAVDYLLSMPNVFLSILEGEETKSEEKEENE